MDTNDLYRAYVNDVFGALSEYASSGAPIRWTSANQDGVLTIQVRMPDGDRYHELLRQRMTETDHARTPPQ